MQKKMAAKKLKKIKFEKVEKQHLDYFNEKIMSN